MFYSTPYFSPATTWGETSAPTHLADLKILEPTQLAFGECRFRGRWNGIPNRNGMEFLVKGPNPFRDCFFVRFFGGNLYLMHFLECMENRFWPPELQSEHLIPEMEVSWVLKRSQEGVTRRTPMALPFGWNWLCEVPIIWPNVWKNCWGNLFPFEFYPSDSANYNYRVQSYGGWNKSCTLRVPEMIF